MTKPGSEHIAQENLERQGYETYLPKYKYAKPGQKARILCLFPRYIFIHVEQFFHSINGTRGITHLLMADGKPASLSPKIIDDLKARADKRGLISLEPKPKFEPGAAVKLAEGSMVGYSVIVQEMTGPQRVKVLMDILGRKVSIVVDEKSLVA